MNAETNKIIRATQSAFTLMEVLVVVAVIGIILAMAMPMVANMGTLVRADRAETSIIMAAALTQKMALGDREEFLTVDKDNFRREYRGVAAVITPYNEIVFYKSNEVFKTGSYKKDDDKINKDDHVDFREIGVTAKPLANHVGDSLPHYYSFYDLQTNMEPIPISRDFYVFGMVSGDGGALRLVPPPFAILYNGQGKISYTNYNIADPTAGLANANYINRFVYIDHEFDHRIDINSTRGNVTGAASGAPYEPAKWTPTESAYDPDDLSTDTSKAGRFYIEEVITDNEDTLRSYVEQSFYNNQLKMPFARLETVIGVVVVKRSDFIEAGHTYGADPEYTPDDDEYAWVLANGRPMVFNYYNGLMGKE